MSRRKRYTRNLGRTLPEPTPRRTTTAWLRFEHRDEPYGAFSYGSLARARLDAAGRARFEALMAWFREHLPSPALGETSARFWFVESASAHVDRARELAALLVAIDVPIVERRTTRLPGKRTWSDALQLAVLTYRDTPRPRR